MNLPIYLDNNSTTPMDPRVLDAMLPYFNTKFGNAASRNHAFGWAAEEGVDYAREQVAKLIGANEKEIIFTSGATESDNLAIKGVFEMYKDKGNHIITCVTEHKAVIDACKHVEKLGGEVTYLGVKSDGLIDLAELEAAMTEKTILVAIMYGNNEIGVIQPIREISAIAHKHGALFMTDAVQAVGKIPVDVNADGIDLMAFTGHKMYGPKGIGALYVRRKNPRVKVTAQMDGGGHERGMRSGTLNVPGIVGFAKAIEIAIEEMSDENKKYKKWTDIMLEKFTTSGAKLNGHPTNRLLHNLNIRFDGIESKAIINSVSKKIAISAGSACTTQMVEPSHVLLALGLSEEESHNAIRIGCGRFNTDAEIDIGISEIVISVNALAKIRI